VGRARSGPPTLVGLPFSWGSARGLPPLRFEADHLLSAVESGGAASHHALPDLVHDRATSGQGRS
jgi:hypothetical protein